MSVFEQKTNGFPTPNYEYITDEGTARRALNELMNYPELQMDIEATALDPFEARWTLFQVGTGAKSYIFDVRHDTSHSSIHPELFKPLLTDNKILKILQNANYDMKVIKRSIDTYITNVFDTMLAEQLLNLGRGFIRANLQSLVERYLGLVMEKEAGTTFQAYGQTYQQFQLEYAANDVVPLNVIKDNQWAKITKESLENALRLESEFLVPLCEMELNGIKIDIDKWNIIMKDVEVERTEIKKVIQDILGETDNQTTLFGVSLINIDSNAQLKSALARFGINLDSTAKDALEKYKGIPIIDAILDYRKASKLISTYADSLLAKISPVTGRLHTDFRQMVSTGRMSSSNPNLQNIPKQQRYRSCFISPEGYSLLTADMSGAELRILGNLSMDPVFIEAYATGQDLHTRTASEMFGISYEEAKQKKYRGAAKAIGFGLCYGMSAVGLAKRLNVTDMEAKSLLNAYFNKYKGVKRYLDRAGKEAVMNRYSTTVSGRRRYYNMPPFDHPDRKKIQNSVERKGKNAGIQGCLVADTKVKGFGNIDNLVDRNITLSTGFGVDRASGVYSGSKEVYDLKLSNGVSLGITLDHKIPVVRDSVAESYIEDVVVKDLNENHYLMIPLNAVGGSATDLSGYSYTKGHWRETFVDFKCPNTMSDKLAFVIGCLLGDGSYTKHNHFKFVCPEHQIEVMEKFNTYVKELFGYTPVIKMLIRPERSTALYISQVSSVVIRGFLKHIGLDYVKHRQKKIPEYFFTDTIANRGALLNGLFSTDGGMTKNSGPNFTSSSKDIANGVQQLLFSLGINSNLKEYTEKGKQVFRLNVPKRFNNKFKKYVGFSVAKKQKDLIKCGSIPKFGDDSIVPEFIPRIIEKVLRRSSNYFKEFSPNEKAHLRRFKLGKCSFTSWRKFYKRIPDCPEKRFLSKYLDYDFCKFKSLSFRGKEDTYDLMCDNVHYFTANGIIVHNSNADTIKESMILLVERLKPYDARLILTVHDEVVVEVKTEQKEEVAKVVSQSLVDGFGRYFSIIPMRSDTLVGPCWLKGECEKTPNCGSTHMEFVPSEKYGTKLVCSKCGKEQD